MNRLKTVRECVSCKHLKLFPCHYGIMCPTHIVGYCDLEAQPQTMCRAFEPTTAFKIWFLSTLIHKIAEVMVKSKKGDPNDEA